MIFRDARDEDGAALLALIGGVFDEYPGCVTDPDEMPELRGIASYVREHRGEFWVAEDGSGKLVACCGYTRVPGGVELKKLYVDKSARRQGVAARLCERVEAAARKHGAAFVELWSDTRFQDAHRLYQKRGFVKTGETRELHDKSDTVEFYFRLTLTGIG